MSSIVDREQVRTALERNLKAVSLRPGVGQGTARTVARLGPGLSCEVTEGQWSFTAGMTEKYGGTAAGPNPGVYGRGALASCLTIGYGMWAARLDVPIDALTVEVEADYDVRGELGVADDVRPGYLEIRYIVTVESSAAEADVMRVLDTADRYSSYRDIFSSMPLRREVRLSAANRG
jgi:uncharacterized OsmC-like protein